MAETESTRHQEDAPAPRRGPGRWFYGGIAALGVAGAALMLIALRPSIDEPGTRSVPAAATPAAAAPETAAADTPVTSAPPATQPPAFPAELDTFGISIGPPDAPLVVREFSDYQCPACRAFSTTAKRIREEYVASGKVRFVLFDIPLTSIHPHALVSAQAARCAGAQGDYWAMHDALFDNQTEWSAAAEPVDHFVTYATDVGLDGDALQRCVASGETRAAVERSYAFAVQIGVRSTPSILVGNVPLVGSHPYERVRDLIEQQLAAGQAR